ncbi:heme ABC transporter permease CcmC [Cellvibrio sp.]|jgi:heme exporter protein C
MRWNWLYKLGTPSWFYQYIRAWLPYMYSVAFVLLLVGTVWGLGFAPIDSKQGNSYRILFIHAPVAHIAEVAYVLMAIMGAVGLIWKTKLSFMMMKASAPLGAAFTFVALVTGSIWGKPTWGAWWVWDARITSMLILFFLFLGVYALQDAYKNSDAGNKAAAVLSLVGVINVIIIKKSVEWWYTLHQPASIMKGAVDISMLIPLLINILGMYILYLSLLFSWSQVEILRQERRKQWVRDIALKSEL